MLKPLILSVLGKSPRFGNNVFIAPNASIVGDVTVGAECSIWFNTVVRGDVHRIEIGDRTNIQDGAILHCTYQKAPLKIGSEVSIGHGAIVHGCTVHDRVLIGMGAKVLDHAVIESEVIIAAGALVLENFVAESGYLYAGIPARKIKPLTEAQKELLKRTADNYILYASWFDSEENGVNP
jgi:carbonic anhydrase/acetyltransferase-like protein (isoleucine patch superfamily)